MTSPIERYREPTRYREPERPKPRDPLRLTDRVDPAPATKPATKPAATTSNPATTPATTPTLRTALEGRALHTANTGAAYRAFQLQRSFAPTASAPATTSAPTPAPSTPSPLPTDAVELSPEQRAAQATYERWSDPATLERELNLRGNNLNTFTDEELAALAALSIDHPNLQDTIRSAAVNTVREAESLDDIPSAVGYQYLLETFVLDDEGDRDENGEVDGEHLNAGIDYHLLVKDEISDLLDDNLEGARGDEGLEDALDDFTGDLEDFIAGQPASASLIEGYVREEFEERGEEFQDIQRADDPWYSDAGHLFTDGVRGLASALADNLFPQSPPTNGRPYFGPYPDFFNNPAVRELTNFGAGFSYAGHGAIESLGELVADPIGSAKALVEVVKDPSLLLAGYREAAELYGPSGAAGAIGFDFMTAVVGAAALPSGVGSAALRTLIRSAHIFPDIPLTGKFGREAAELIDEATDLTESSRFLDLPTELQDNILDAIGRNPADVAGRRAVIGLVDSDAFSGLDLAEQERLVRYVGGDNPYISAPARAQLQELLDDPNYTALSPTEQADRLRQFTGAESPYYIIEPPEGTYRPIVDATIGPGQAITHNFNSGANIPAHRYDVSIDGRNVEVVVPDTMAWGAGNQHSLDEVVEALRSMPEANRAGVDRIVLEPGPDPSNGTYASGAASYMTAGADGSVRIYPTEQPASFEALTSSMVHETAHVLTHREWGSPTRVPNGDGTFRFEYNSEAWNRYRAAAEADGVLPSGYGAVDIGEDAAEMMRLYSMVQNTPYEAEIRALYTNRFELLDELLAGG